MSTKRPTGWIRYVRSVEDEGCLRPQFEFAHQEKRPPGNGWDPLYREERAPWAWRFALIVYMGTLLLGAIYCIAYYARGH